MADYYNLLTVSRNASAADIKTKYRQLSLRYHPDSGGSTEKMVQLNQAYQTLSNPLLRREYDQKISIPPRPKAPHASYAYAQPPSATYAPPRPPVYRPRPEPTVQKYHRRDRRNDKYVEESNSFWSWLGIASILVIAFLGYQLYSFINPASSTSSTSPLAPAVVNSTPSTTTTPATDTTSNPAPDTSTDPSSTDPNGSTGYYRRYRENARDTNDASDTTTYN